MAPDRSGSAGSLIENDVRPHAQRLDNNGEYPHEIDRPVIDRARALLREAGR